MKRWMFILLTLPMLAGCDATAPDTYEAAEAIAYKQCVYSAENLHAPESSEEIIKCAAAFHRPNPPKKGS